MSNSRDAFKIFVANLPFDMDEGQIQKYFERYGPVINVFLMKDNTQKSRGKAFISFQRKGDAYECIKDLDHANFEGRTLLVKEAIDQSSMYKSKDLNAMREKREHKLPMFKLNPKITKTPEIKQYEKMLDQLKQSILQMAETLGKSSMPE